MGYTAFQDIGRPVRAWPTRRGLLDRVSRLEICQNTWYAIPFVSRNVCCMFTSCPGYSAVEPKRANDLLRQDAGAPISLEIQRLSLLTQQDDRRLNDARQVFESRRKARLWERVQPCLREQVKVGVRAVDLESRPPGEPHPLVWFLFRLSC